MEGAARPGPGAGSTGGAAPVLGSRRLPAHERAERRRDRVGGPLGVGGSGNPDAGPDRHS